MGAREVPPRDLLDSSTSAPFSNAYPTVGPIGIQELGVLPNFDPLVEEALNSFVLRIVQVENTLNGCLVLVATCTLSFHQHGIVLIGWDDADPLNLRTLEALPVSELAESSRPRTRGYMVPSSLRSLPSSCGRRESVRSAALLFGDRRWRVVGVYVYM